MREGGARYWYLFFLELSWWHGRERLAVAEDAENFRCPPEPVPPTNADFRVGEGVPDGQIYLTEG